MDATTFTQIRIVLKTAVDLYNQLGKLKNMSVSVSGGLIGFDGFYPVDFLKSVEKINVTNDYKLIENEPLAHSLMPQYLTLKGNYMPGRPQYAVVFYQGPVSQLALRIANMMRADGITVIPYHVNGVVNGGDFKSTVEYQDALNLAGGIASNVGWLPRTSIDNGNVEPVRISNELKIGTMEIGMFVVLETYSFMF